MQACTQIRTHARFVEIGNFIFRRKCCTMSFISKLQFIKREVVRNQLGLRYVIWHYLYLLIAQNTARFLEKAYKVKLINNNQDLY